VQPDLHDHRGVARQDHTAQTDSGRRPRIDELAGTKESHFAWPHAMVYVTVLGTSAANNCMYREGCSQSWNRDSKTACWRL
jgi:hypothetical protein